jgi:hypothetical protein
MKNVTMDKMMDARTAKLFKIMYAILKLVENPSVLFVVTESNNSTNNVTIKVKLAAQSVLLSKDINVKVHIPQLVPSSKENAEMVSDNMMKNAMTTMSETMMDAAFIAKYKWTTYAKEP